MDQWPPEIVFPLTGLLAGLAGAATEARQHKVIKVTDGMLHAIYYGFAGASLSMLCYQAVDGAKHPEVVIALGMLVGLRVLAVNLIRSVATQVVKVIPADEDKEPKP